MTTEAVSDYLALSRKRVNELIRSGELPAVVRGPVTRGWIPKIGRRRR